MKDLLLRDAEKLSELFADLIQSCLREAPVQALAGPDITPAQLDALRYIARHQPASVGDLAEGLAVSAPAATKAVDRLVQKALVTRTENVRDRRLSDLGMTEEGENLLNQARHLRSERLEQILARMSGDDQRALLKGLRGFITAAFMTDTSLIDATCHRCGTEHYAECIVNQAHLALLGTEIQRI